MRRNGTDAGVRAGILGQSREDLTKRVYDHPDVTDFEKPLADIATQLLPNQLLQSVTKNEGRA